jgi:hypothetical protein
VASGGGGNDRITGFGGNDEIRGGDDDDKRGLAGGPGDDEIFGQDGDDRLFGDEDDDRLNGGPDDDECDGGGQPGDVFINCEDQSDSPPENLPNTLEVFVAGPGVADESESPVEYIVTVVNRSGDEAGPAEDVRVNFEVENTPFGPGGATASCDTPPDLNLGDVPIGEGGRKQGEITQTCAVDGDDINDATQVCIDATARGSDGSQGGPTRECTSWANR